MTQPLAWLLFLAACAAGAVARYQLDRSVSARAAGGFPWGIWLVNVSGSILLGVLAGLTLRNGWDPAILTVIGTGFCGSYTTFSTFAVQSTVRGRTAAWYVIASVGAAIAAAALGLAMAGGL